MSPFFHVSGKCYLRSSVPQTLESEPRLQSNNSFPTTPSIELSLLFLKLNANVIPHAHCVLHHTHTEVMTVEVEQTHKLPLQVATASQLCDLTFAVFSPISHRNNTETRWVDGDCFQLFSILHGKWMTRI